MEVRKKDNVRAGEGQVIHRYSGPIVCGDCGRSAVGKRIKLKDGHRVEYVCKGYHNHGKEFCSSHRIREECLDTQVVKHAETLRESWAEEQTNLQRLYKQWSLRQPALNREIARLREEVQQLEEDIDELLTLRIQANK